MSQTSKSLGIKSGNGTKLTNKALVIMDYAGHNHVFDLSDPNKAKQIIQKILKAYDALDEDDNDFIETLDWDMINQILMDIIPCNARELIVDVDKNFNRSIFE